METFREPMRFGKKADFLREPMRFGKRTLLREPMRFGKRQEEHDENIGSVMEDFALSQDSPMIWNNAVQQEPVPSVAESEEKRPSGLD